MTCGPHSKETLANEQNKMSPSETQSLRQVLVRTSRMIPAGFLGPVPKGGAPKNASTQPGRRSGIVTEPAPSSSAVPHPGNWSLPFQPPPVPKPPPAPVRAPRDVNRALGRILATASSASRVRSARGRCGGVARGSGSWRRKMGSCHVRRVEVVIKTFGR